MQFNVKNREANELIEQLVAVTGESKTQAVTEAVRERLCKIERERSLEERLAKVMAIVDAIRAQLPEKLPTQAEMDAWFYDEDGMPK
jgi:antitoxin VapB